MYPLGDDIVTLEFTDGTECTGRQWCDILCTENAKPIVSYANRHYQGKAAVTENHYGDGLAYYVGIVSEKKFYYKFIKYILETTGIDFIDGLPENVEITTREGKGKEVQFIFNDTDVVQEFILCGKKLHLEPFEMKINHL